MARFSLQPGQVVGERYRLRQMIGAGGMGAVWSARDEVLGLDVAVKFLHPGLLRDPLVVQRFVQEAELGAPLRHPFIIVTYGSGRHVPPDAREPIPYIVTELLDGEPLADVLGRAGALPVGAALAILRDVARAADAAHQAGVLHRDLKPANVFLHVTSLGDKIIVTPKVLDFGVSKTLDPTLDVGLTTTGMLVGSPSYMSPEQAVGKRDLDARSDVWSIGVMLHRALSGKALWENSGAPGMLRHIAERDVTLDDLTGLPEEVVAIVRRCLRRDRNERFPRASDLADAIDALLGKLDLSTDLEPLLRGGCADETARGTTGADGGPSRADRVYGPPEPPDPATVALARAHDETGTRLAVAVPPRRSPGWALPLLAVGGVGTIALVVAVASRAWISSPPESGVVAAASPALPSADTASATTASASTASALPAPPLAPPSRAQVPPPVSTPPAPAPPPTPPATKKPPRIGSSAAPRPTDVARQPGF